jgi:hypothetical protein
VRWCGTARRNPGARAPARHPCAPDLRGDPGRLVGLVGRLHHRERLALRVGRAERLALPLNVLRDHTVRGVQDSLRRAVVLLQPHEARGLEVLLEVQDVADVGPAPAVDRLVVVADHEEVAPAGFRRLRTRLRRRQQLEEDVLRVVRVLVLVDQHEAEAVAVTLQHGGMPAQQVDRLDEQVVEVERIGVPQRLLVEHVGIRDRAAERSNARSA